MKIRRIAFILFAASCIAQDTGGVGAVRGRVIEETSSAAVANAAVCLLAPQPRCADTDAGGRFRISEVRTGTYPLQVRSSPGIAHSASSVEVRAGVEVELQITVPAMGTVHQTVEVKGSVDVVPEEVKTSGHLIAAHDVQKDASAMKDVARYVQTLPGAVFGGDDFRNDIVVRGGSPLENLYIVDNIEVPNLSHFGTVGSAGGPIGLLNSELLADVTFLTGGYPAVYSNRLSSVLQITQREGSRERVHAHATVGLAGAGGIAEGPLTAKGSWLVSARRSFLDVFGIDAENGGVPVYTNAQAKAVYDVNASNRVWALSIGGWDSIVERPDPRKEGQEDEVTNVDYRGWRNASGFNWQQLFGARGVGLLGATFSRGRVRNEDRDLRLANALVGSQDLTEDEYALKYDLTLNVPGFKRLQAGTNARWIRADYRYRQPLGIENPFSPAYGRVDPMSFQDHSTNSQPSAYLQITRPLGHRVSLSVGGRADRYGALGAARFSPRAGLTIRVTDRVSVSGSFGTYYQQPYLLYVKAAPVNRGLAPMRADHFVAGLTYVPSASLLFTIEAYEKRYRDYPVSLEYPQVTLASAGDAYDPMFYLLPMTSAGRGRSRGLELYARKRMTSRLYGQATLKVARDLSVRAFLSQAVNNRHAMADERRIDLAVVYNALGPIRRAGMFQ